MILDSERKFPRQPRQIDPRVKNQDVRFSVFFACQKSRREVFCFLQAVQAALRVLEEAGFDVKSLWRELSDRMRAVDQAQNEPAPLASLDLSLDAILLQSPSPLLALRKRGALLTSEIDRITLEMDRLQNKKLSFTVTRTERKEINSRLAKLKDELSGRKAQQHEVTHATKEIAKNARYRESTKVFDAMRISKLGVRGESHLD